MNDGKPLLIKRFHSISGTCIEQNNIYLSIYLSIYQATIIVSSNNTVVYIRSFFSTDGSIYPYIATRHQTLIINRGNHCYCNRLTTVTVSQVRLALAEGVGG